MRVDFYLEPKPTERFRNSKIFRRMSRTALVGFGIGLYELVVKNEIAAGVALGSGILASAGVGVITYIQEHRIEQGQNEISPETSN